MKKILIFSIGWTIFAFAFVSFSFGQGLVLKEKTSPQKVVDSTVVVDSGKSSNIITPLVLKEKTNKGLKLDDGKTTTVNPTVKTSPQSQYLFPLSQVEIFVGYVQYKEYRMTGNGAYGQITVRQKQDERKKTSWGLGGCYGQFTTKNSETDSTTFTSKVKELGGFLSYARNTNRPNWNSVVLNFGFKQAVDEGSISSYKRKQVDILFTFSGYIDLTRNKNIGFSRSNLSWYYQNPLRTEVETYDKGFRVNDDVWNKKMLFINFDQTVLQFDLNDAIDNFSANLGVNAGYKHFSHNKRDTYCAGLFTEFFYKFCKVGRLGFEVNIDPKSNPDRYSRFLTGKKQEFKLDLDLYQIGRVIL